MVELGEDSGTKIWCKMLARVNNVERDSQIWKWNKYTNSNEWHTETHTQIDKWGCAMKEWAQNVEATENACVAQLKRDASTIAHRRIRHLCTTYKRQKCNKFYPKYAMYMMFRWYDPRWSDMTILCNVVWCYGTCLEDLCSLFFFLLKSLFSFFCMATCEMHKPR